ncbi:MAG: YceD family protein [Burkholderiaceae bacterium]
MQRTIDTSELARAGSELSGAYPLAGMERLGSLLADRQGEVAWRLRAWRAGRADGASEDRMALSIVATVRMACVRCMAPVTVELSAERSYRLARSEAEAERLDLDDQVHDVLAGGRRFDLAGLVEDEAIMALPATPRHERCDLPGVAGQAVDDDALRRPFAALERLKNGAQNTDIIED